MLQTRVTASVPLLAWLTELLFPTRCVACGSSGTLLCEACLLSLPRLGPPACERCGAPTAWPVATCRECGSRRLAFDSARAAIPYDATGRRIVRAWKERGLRRFTPYAAELVAGRVPRPAADVITYIPPDAGRSAERGHHPAQALAEALGERWGLPVDRLLARTRHVARQAELPRAARRGNVRGAFAPARKRVPERVVLVDDVYTTGATVDAAANALRKAGAREVRVVTFARVTRVVR